MQTININTASPLLLAAVTHVPESIIKAALANREITPFTQSNDFLEALKLHDPSLDTTALGPILGISSNYFLVETTVSFQKYTITTYTFLYRSSTDPATVQLERRARGVI